MSTLDVEYTDTFGGEANYAWVRRATITAPENASDSLLIRRAKRAIGIDGRHRVDSYGDTIVVLPYGTCTVLFITYRESQT